jgi:hypothetical protein
VLKNDAYTLAGITAVESGGMYKRLDRPKGFIFKTRRILND